MFVNQEPCLNMPADLKNLNNYIESQKKDTIDKKVKFIILEDSI